MEFSLFHFADDPANSKNRYHLMLESARFADEHGFAAVWTPERHFHPFGGSYPNPSVTGAAIAAITSRVAVRAGSVVGPLHPPLRIAEEWSVVDNLSDGRAGASFASGWHAVDFSLRPENYASRRDVVVDTITTVQRLWRGEAVEVSDGTGKPASVRIFPSPVQSELPIWLTSAGTVETFRVAGRLGVGVLTHLLGQSLDDLAGKIAEYRRALAQHHPNVPGHVALMLHTFIGTDRDTVREIVREPFSEYLRSSIGLIVRASGDLLPGVDPENLSPDDISFLVERSFDRYFETGGLMGTVEDGLTVLRKLHHIGVDEVACLHDFIPDSTVVLDGLEHLDRLKNTWHATV